MELIKCVDAGFAYDGRMVLENVDFTVEEGEYLCIAGENGAGKSTLLKGLLHLKAPAAGRVEFENGMSQADIGYLPQQTAAQKDFPASVYEVVLSGRLNRKSLFSFYDGSDRKEAQDSLRLLEISDLKDRCYRELSGGQQQRVLLARALCASKKLLIMDEPVAGLDPVMTEAFYRIIDGLNEKRHMSVIMVSHDIREAVRHATHILQLGSRQLFFGKVSDYLVSEEGRIFLERSVDRNGS